jgi:putative transcriptional regulator
MSSAATQTTGRHEEVQCIQGLAPGLLIAAPNLADPTFNHTVILLVENGPWGSYGMVINRPAPVDLSSLLESAGIPHQSDLPRTVWLGGPVQPQSGLVLYRDEPGLASYDPHAGILPGMRISSSMHLLRDIAQGQGPRQYALFLGRASWVAGQLEQELAAGLWLPAEADASLLFAQDQDACWRRALATIGTDPAHIASGAASA